MNNGKWFLTFVRKGEISQLGAQGFLVGRFVHAWPQCAMHGYSRANDCPCEFVVLVNIHRFVFIPKSQR